MYLNPLKRIIENYEGNEFVATANQLEPILHCICLVWANSRYYCLSQRIVNLLKMFGNTIVEQVGNIKVEKSSTQKCYSSILTIWLAPVTDVFNNNFSTN